MSRATIKHVADLPGVCSGAAVSPDGQFIAIACSVQGYDDIYLVKRDGTGLVCLTESAKDNVGAYYNPHFSPDGTSIVCLRRDVPSPYPPERSDLCCFHLPSSSLNQLTTTGDDDDAQFSPDGEYLVFTSWRNGNSKIYNLEINEHKESRLTHTEFDRSLPEAFLPRNYAPAYSPDGKRIAFLSTHHDGRNGNGELHTMLGDGSGLTRISNTKGGCQQILWYPDNDQIVALCIEEIGNGSFQANVVLFDLHMRHHPRTLFEIIEPRTASTSLVSLESGGQCIVMNRRHHIDNRTGTATPQILVINTQTGQDEYAPGIICVEDQYALTVTPDKNEILSYKESKGQGSLYLITI
jgi:dipeptidyl aminopeptidase/acylaminoacyl peptidase